MRIKGNRLKHKSIKCIIASSVLIATFIGNTAVPIIASTSYFTDTFESGSSEDWNIEKGSWSIVSDSSKAFKSTSTSSEGRAIRGDKSWDNYVVEGELKLDNDNSSNKAYLCGRYMDTNNYYGVGISTKNGGSIELKKKLAGKSSVLKSKNVSINAGTYYKIKIEMQGSQIKVYLNNEQLFDVTDTSISNGAVGLVTSKITATYDNISVTASDSNSQIPSVPGEPSIPEVPETPSNNNSLSKYSVEGFSYNNTGGGVISESSKSYAKVSNAVELGQALKKGSGIKVIEITNDIDLGWNEIPSSARTAPITQHTSALTHPTLKKTGVSKITVDSFDGLTIFSKNGSTLKHAGITFKNSKNVVIRNLKFDELWEWDENTKGKYDRNDWDFLTFEGCKNVWVDHCTFGKAYDGIIDSKNGTTGLTVSWSKFLPGDGTFYNVMFDEMEKNTSNYPMYKFIRNQNLSKADIMKIASPQKKTHLIGAREFASDNSNLEITLHHNYYKDTQDRIPRLRGGNAHVYNILVDSTNAYNAKKLISSSVSKAIESAGYSFTVTSNGAISTEDGALLMEKSYIAGIAEPLKNNQKSASKDQYTGKIQAVDTIYKFDNINFRGNSTDKNSPLSPSPAAEKAFSWNNYSKLPYTYSMDDPSELSSILTGSNGAGSGVLNLTSKQWMTTKY